MVSEEGKFNNYKLQLQLEAQMPMIHFQSMQPGATIRASEVKPKLDRFILDKIMVCCKKTIEELKKEKDYKDIFLDPESDINCALDYKMQITAKESSKIDLSPKNSDGKSNRAETYSIFYANMGRKPKETVYGIFSDPVITIICFKDKLRKYIEENIIQFFLVTNFGTMQNKGFGSFIPANWCQDGTLTKEKEKEVASYFDKLNPGCHCYVMRFQESPAAKKDMESKNVCCVNMSENIKSFYSNMKSGQNFQGYSRSYLYQYMHNEIGIGNEKAWMKKKGISPNICKPQNMHKEENGKTEEYYYVRAFLGTGTTIQYAPGYTDESYKKLAKKVPITIESTGTDERNLERVSSPIFFKVIKNDVFIVASEIPDELYDAEFEFDGSNFKGEKGKIKTPSKEVFAKTGNRFDIQDFMDKYVAYYNGDLRNKIKIYSNEEVKRIDA